MPGHYMPLNTKYIARKNMKLLFPHLNLKRYIIVVFLVAIDICDAQWLFQNSPTNNHINDVSFTDSLHGWVVGNNGIIFHTRDIGWAVGQNGTIAYTDNAGITSTNDFFTNSPSELCRLYQNYPNPFNPVTTIEFYLPKTSNVTLKIYNILGEEVSTLVSGRLNSGAHQYEWSWSAGMTSGVYLYRLETGEFVQTKKMILMR